MTDASDVHRGHKKTGYHRKLDAPCITPKNQLKTILLPHQCGYIFKKSFCYLKRCTHISAHLYFSTTFVPESLKEQGASVKHDTLHNPKKPIENNSSATSMWLYLLEIFISLTLLTPLRRDLF